MEWTFFAPVGLSQSASLLGRSLLGLSLMELIHALALALLASSPAPTTLVHRLPQPTQLPIARSRGFHHAWGTTHWSDDSPGAASHFAHAYRVASPGATREPDESSWGHVMIFCTVPSANTLIRWVDERRLRPHSAGSTCPHLRPTGSSWGGPHRLRPGTSPHALRIPPRGGHPALRAMSGGSWARCAVSRSRRRARVWVSLTSSRRPGRS